MMRSTVNPYSYEILQEIGMVLFTDVMVTDAVEFFILIISSIVLPGLINVIVPHERLLFMQGYRVLSNSLILQADLAGNYDPSRPVFVS